MEKRIGRRAVFALAFASLASFFGCGPKPDAPSGFSYSTCLYMTDTKAGKVFAYDPATRSASGSSLAATAQNSTGEISFYRGLGYVCVADYSNTAPGLYRFDPSASNPTLARIGGAIDAQYAAFFGPAKAYLGTYGEGLYSFDPASASVSFTAVDGTAGKAIQEIVVGADGSVYAADNGGAVLRVDPSDDTVAATIATSAGGTTGLFAGTLNGSAGVFVANTGGYDPITWDPLPGSIDFIASGSAAIVANALPGGGPIYPARLAQLSDGDLVVTGYGHTYRVDLSASPAVVSELQASGASFGGMDIALKDGLVYIPSSVTSDYVSYSNFLYVLGEDGSQERYSPVSVMGSGESVSNVAFYED